MSAVASKLPLCATLALYLVGCAGNVVEGLPRDGGSADDPREPGAEVSDGSVRRDAASNGGGLDAGKDEDPEPTGPVRDANTPSTGNQDATTPRNDAAAPAGNDAGQPTSETALNGPALARPSNGREFTADTSKWMGAPRCKLDQVLFCDDFEAQAAGGALGSAWTTAANKPTVSDDYFYRGGKAMRVEVAAGMPAQAQQVQTFPMAKDKVFGRMFVYFVTLPTSPSNAHWTLVEVGGLGSDKTQVRLGGQIDPTRGSKNYFGVGSDGGGSGDWHTAGREPQSEVKTQTWYCLEFMFDRVNSETRVWIDNVEQLSLHTTKANYRVGDAEGGKEFVHPTYEYAKVGWWVYQGDTQPASNVTFIDEVVFDDDQIGCSF
jgi:hypothetical protein